MSTAAAPSPVAPRSKGGLWTYLMILATLGVAFVVLVEIINVLFYDPYGDKHFLFTLSGSLEGIDIGPLTFLMFGSLALLLMMGLPMAFVVGGLGVVFIYLVGGQTMVNIIPTRIFPLMTNPDLAAIPLFIFMASMLERAGLIEEMFDVVYKWLGGLNGGLAAATILASTILAAMVGVIGAAVVTMGIIALPAMLKRNYDQKIGDVVSVGEPGPLELGRIGSRARGGTDPFDRSVEIEEGVPRDRRGDLRADAERDDRLVRDEQPARLPHRVEDRRPCRAAPRS